MIQVFTRRRNIDSTVCTFRFDCFKFEFHSGAAATFATISAISVHRGLSLDDLVGDREQRGRHGEAQRFHRLEIDHKLEFCRLFDWNIRRLLAFQYFVD